MHVNSILKALVLGAFLFFQVAEAANTVEDEKHILNSVFPETCDFAGQFLQQKQIQGLPLPLESTGNFFFSCGLGLIWNAETPFQEALLFANSATNFKVDEYGKTEPLSGAVKFGMSRFFLRLFKGDIDYFVENFSINHLDNGAVAELVPETTFMKKGIDRIHIQKIESAESELALSVVVFDATGQRTDVMINKIKEYQFESKQQAFDQCEQLYTRPKEYCRMLRSPWRYEK